MDYFPAFGIMAAVLIAAIPLFLVGVTHEGGPEPEEGPKTG
jgi:hypothetical protein